MDQDRDKADFVARNALSRMTMLGIPPTPRNFVVWYGYFSNRPLDLKKTLDALIDSGRNFDAVLCEEVYRRFFGQEADAAEVARTSEAVDSLLETLVGRISAHDRSAEAYGGALADAQTALSRGEIGGIVAKLVEETHRMASINQEMQEHLKSASSEIDGLRQSLVEAREQADTDALTGIANRKRFDAFLRDAIARTGSEPLALLMVDIDHFKRFNDTHGHQVGDQVLRLVARTLTDCIREGDLPARYGGEEFAVILPRTPVSVARPIAERIRTTLAARKIVRRNTGEALGGITISVGAALYRPGEAPASLIGRADSALYAAKRQGRNRLIVENEAAS